MKRFLCIFLICMIPIISIADGINLSELSFDDLLALRTQVEAEIISRQEWKEVTVPSGTWIVGKDIPAGFYSVYPTSRGAFLLIKDTNGKIKANQGIRTEIQAFGRIELCDGDVVNVSDGSLIFAPPKGLGF